MMIMIALLMIWLCVLLIVSAPRRFSLPPATLNRSVLHLDNPALDQSSGLSQ